MNLVIAIEVEMTKEEMKDLLDRIIAAKYLENSFFYEEPMKPVSGGPASEQELRLLDSHLAAKGVKTPADYRLFLSVYDGIENVLAPDYSLLPASKVIAGDYGTIEELAEEFPTCVQFVIGAGNTPEFVGFDISTSQTEGDYEVVWVSADANGWRLRNFQDFLAGYLAVLERRVARQKKDRENLAP